MGPQPRRDAPRLFPRRAGQPAAARQVRGERQGDGRRHRAGARRALFQHALPGEPDRPLGPGREDLPRRLRGTGGLHRRHDGRRRSPDRAVHRPVRRAGRGAHLPLGLRRRRHEPREKPGPRVYRQRQLQR
jgi:hypothetical protein